MWISNINLNIIHKRLKASAKKRNIDFNLKLHEMNQISFPISCPILGIKLEFNSGSPKDNSFSFDRINNEIGYCLDNIQIISYKANRAKNNLSEKELKDLTIWILENIS